MSDNATPHRPPMPVWTPPPVPQSRFDTSMYRMHNELHVSGPDAPAMHPAQLQSANQQRSNPRDLITSLQTQYAHSVIMPPAPVYMSTLSDRVPHPLLPQQ